MTTVTGKAQKMQKTVISLAHLTTVEIQYPLVVWISGCSVPPQVLSHAGSDCGLLFKTSAPYLHIKGKQWGFLERAVPVSS